jgi:DeoR/GlpR family transcriptional regulator of sugar metabolism
LNDHVHRSLRHKAIIRAVGGGRVGIDDLVRLTGVSAVTIRRDLRELAVEGLVRRVHGGASAPLGRGVAYPIDERLGEKLDIKRQLARVVADDVPDGSAVFLDNGTSALAVAEALAGRRITVLTTSLRAVMALAPAQGMTVVVPAGTIEAETLEVAGAGVIDAIRGMQFDLAVLGACAASPTSGLTVSGWHDAQVKREAVRQSRARVLVTAGDKLGRTAAHRFADLEDLTGLYTDRSAAPSLVDAYRAAGVDVHLVSDEGATTATGWDVEKPPC